MSKPTLRTPRRWIALTVIAAGGTLLGTTCEVRLRDAVFDAGRQTILSIFDPSNVADFFNQP